MKSLKSILLVAALSLCSLTTTVTAQTQFDYLGGMPVSANATGCFYMDLNTYGTNTGENDVKLVHGSGEIYFDALYADSALMPFYFNNSSGNRVQYWQDCADGNLYQSQRVYIIKGNYNIGLGSHVLPFRHSGKYHFLVLNIISTDSLTIRGWVFNIPHEDFECYNLEATASIEEHAQLFTGLFKDYNCLGQMVDEFHTGITLRVYENGRSERIYR